MSKKQRSVIDKKSIGIVISKINLTNFTLFGKDELEFKSGLNLLKVSTLIEKFMLNFILNLSINIEFYINHKKLDNHTFYLLNSVKVKSEKPLSFITEVFINANSLGNDYDDFVKEILSENIIKIEFTINLDQEILLSLFHQKNKKFIPVTPVILFKLSQILKIVSWQNESLFPCIEFNMMQKLCNLSPSSFYEFTLQLLDLHKTERNYYELLDKNNLLVLEQENFTHLKEQALIRKESLENELKIIKEIKHLNIQISELELEKNWSSYFDLKNKFEGKSANIEQIKNKIDSIKSEKLSLEMTLDQVTKEINDLRVELEAETIEYETKRKSFLSEKASLDKIDRNLKNWDSTSSKAEKELKFKKMKLADKEKKLKDIINRINKDTMKTLEDQKNNIEKEIEKDKLELQPIQ